MDAFGPYRIEGELARGGMGVVLRAQHPQLGRVALKLLHPSGGDVVKQRKRFLREARAARQLDHPHVVRVLDAGEVRGRLYMALELIEGETLEARLRREGPLPPRQAAGLIAALADAVHHAHSEGVLHRDLKPSNVLLDAGGHPRITDFGLVRRLDARLSGTQLTDEGSFLGTPGFWSPEQATGQLDRFGPTTDVYGLGATLFAALTGRPPQGGQTLLQMIAAFERPPPTTEVDPGLDAIVQRALARDPVDRYPSAAALAAELRAWPRTSRAARRSDRAPRPGRRSAGGAGRRPADGAGATSRGALLAGGVLALGVVIAGAILWARAPVGDDPAVAATPADPAPTEPATAAPTPSAPATDDVRGRALVVAARALDDAGQLSAARATYDEALALAPEQADLYRARGELALRLGDVEGALRDLDHAIDLDPRRQLAYFVRATIHDARGDALLALADYDRALEIDERDPRPWHNRGAILSDLGRDAEALESLLRAAEFGSQAAATYEAIGNHFILGGDAARALPAFERAVELEPADPVLWLHVARARHQTGNSRRALDALARCLSLDDRLAAAWHYQGTVHFDAEAWPDAEASFSRALELDPQQPSTWFSRGATRELGGDPRGAARDYERTLELDPQHPQARSRLRGLARE